MWHPGCEGARGTPGGDPAYSGQLPGTSRNLESGSLPLGAPGPVPPGGSSEGGAGRLEVLRRMSLPAGTVPQAMLPPNPGCGFRTLETSLTVTSTPTLSPAQTPSPALPAGSHSEPASWDPFQPRGQSCNQGLGPSRPQQAVGSAALRGPSPWLRPTHNSAQRRALFGRQSVASAQEPAGTMALAWTWSRTLSHAPAPLPPWGDEQPWPWQMGKLSPGEVTDGVRASPGMGQRQGWGRQARLGLPIVPRSI